MTGTYLQLGAESNDRFRLSLDVEVQKRLAFSWIAQEQMAQFPNLIPVKGLRLEVDANRIYRLDLRIFE
jgi:hypothetical protein